MINFASDVLTQQQRWEEADSYAADGVSFDPLFGPAWVMRVRYYFGTGDITAAEAKRVLALYPACAGDPALVETLINGIALAREKAG